MLQVIGTCFEVVHNPWGALTVAWHLIMHGHDAYVLPLSCWDLLEHMMCELSLTLSLLSYRCMHLQSVIKFMFYSIVHSLFL
jgi:hypothetical protein